MLAEPVVFTERNVPLRLVSTTEDSNAGEVRASLFAPADHRWSGLDRDRSGLVSERNEVGTVSTLDGGGGTNTREVENGVVSGPPLVESPLLGYEKPKICHERAEESKSLRCNSTGSNTKCPKKGQIVRRPQPAGLARQARR